MRQQLSYYILTLLLLPMLSVRGQIGLSAEEAASVQMPYFAGCDYLEAGSEEKRRCSNENIVAFISNKLQYPDAAKAINLEGTVLVSFTVDENGEVKDPFVIRDIGEGCGEEAIRVIQNMPVWEPAQQVGRAVAVKLKLRVQFSLNDAEEDFSDVYKISWGLLRGQSVSRDALVNNTRYPLSVRDQYGNELSVSELTFIYSKNDRVREVSSKGHVSADQIDLIKKIKKGGDLTITAVVQKEGSFINVGRVFEILN